MRQELGLVLFIGASLALLVYDVVDFSLALSRSRLLTGAAASVLVVVVVLFAWSRRGR